MQRPDSASNFTWRALLHLAAVLPLSFLAADALTGNLTANPIQAATRRLGSAALWLLTSSLAVSPLSRILRQKRWLAHRRTLGLYAFVYALLHVFLYMGVDHRFAWADIGKALLEKRFIWLGAGAFLILLALAVTSYDFWKKRLGRNWKKLHRLIYLAGILVIFHFGGALKSDLLRLQGNVIQPAVFGLGISILLILRLPAILKPGLSQERCFSKWNKHVRSLSLSKGADSPRTELSLSEERGQNLPEE